MGRLTATGGERVKRSLSLALACSARARHAARRRVNVKDFKWAKQNAWASQTIAKNGAGPLADIVTALNSGATIHVGYSQCAI